MSEKTGKKNGQFSGNLSEFIIEECERAGLGEEAAGGGGEDDAGGQRVNEELSESERAWLGLRPIHREALELAATPAGVPGPVLARALADRGLVERDTGRVTKDGYCVLAAGQNARRRWGTP